MSQFIVGLSGGIGSGKTTVSDLFAKQGIDVIDADVIARDVVQPGQPALTQIAAHFGTDILTADGQLDRRKLRNIVFADSAAKQWLNELLHPLIRKTISQRCAEAGSTYCILSVPLLVENNMTGMVDRVLIVDVSEDTQIERTMRRDVSSENQVRQIMAAQASRREKLAAADDIVDNDGDPEGLPAQVLTLHQKYLALAKR